jgi:ferredoxin
MSLYAMYFSPTGGTKKVVDELCKGWGEEPNLWDLCQNQPVSTQFQPQDVCLVAVPSFGGRVPQVALDRIKTMEGHGAAAVLVCVYGNRAYDDTLLELKDALCGAGFVCLGAVAAVAEHSIMHQFAAGRPDEQDGQQLREFGAQLRQRWEKKENKEVEVPGNRPYREYGGVPMKPKANNNCNGCGRCASHCPVGAIDPQNPKKTDEKTCISCMGCIAVCPQHARKINPLLVAAAGAKMKKACAGRKENELF